VKLEEEHGRVHACDEHRQVVGRERPRLRIRVDDANEEIRKKAPKSIASDAMKRNMPRTVESIRELWFAIGGRDAGVGVRAQLPRPARRRHARPYARPRS
jgi:hypothetical protein